MQRWLRHGSGASRRLRIVAIMLAATVLAVPLIAVAGCSAGASRQADPPTVSSPRASARTSAQPAPESAHRGRVPTTSLTGKFTVGPIGVAGGRLQLVIVGGFVGDGARLSSWQERSTDGGRRWIAGPVTRTSVGVSAAVTQVGLAFVSRKAGWAFQPGLFFTRDGGSSWRPEPGRPAAIGPVAVSGSSTWVTGYPCKSFQCHPTLLQTDRVGGKLTPLPAQPSRNRAIETVLRPSRTTAWVLTAAAHGKQELATTTDAGRHWRQQALPCGERGPNVIAGSRADGLYVSCALRSDSMCGVCGARVLYRSTDAGVVWTRVTPTPTPAYGPRTPADFLQPTEDRTL